jgi:BirA family biotin operon repressor/biotin-[acetyl-CoA-carboxylase] ligase
MSLVVRDPPSLLPLIAAVAVAEVCGREAQIKWPNDVLGDGRKLAGILVEGRPQEKWAVLGIGVNVAVRAQDLPVALRDRAGSLGLEPGDVEPTLQRLLATLQGWLAAREEAVLEAWRARDALTGREITWTGGSGRAVGIDGTGRLMVQRADGGRLALDAGEVHLGR